MRLQLSGLRYYNPELGRWVSRDPIGETGGRNLSAFVRNRPLNRTDPLGLDSNTTGQSAGCCAKAAIDDKAAEALEAAHNASMAGDTYWSPDRSYSSKFEYCGLLCCNKARSEVWFTYPHRGYFEVGVNTRIPRCLPRVRVDVNTTPMGTSPRPRQR